MSASMKKEIYSAPAPEGSVMFFYMAGVMLAHTTGHLSSLIVLCVYCRLLG